MNKLSALDSYKMSVILEGQLEKLSYLDALKSNMGDEMAEMMSQEITRVMEQQRHLEKEYARLVTLRSELKGLSNKNKLQDIRQEILVTATIQLTQNIESRQGIEGFHSYPLPSASGQPRCRWESEENQPG